MYFSGKVPLMVLGHLSCLCLKRVQVTVKLSAESGPSFEHDVSMSNDAADSIKKFFFCIVLI